MVLVIVWIGVVIVELYLDICFGVLVGVVGLLEDFGMLMI